MFLNYYLVVLWGGVVLLCKWSVILVFYCLVFIVSYWFMVLTCLFVLCFHYYFYNWSFRSTFSRRLSILMSLYLFCLSRKNTLCVFRIETMWRLRKIVISALFWRGIHVQCLYGPCWRLLLHWSLLKTLTILLRNKLNYYFY